MGQTRNTVSVLVVSQLIPASLLSILPETASTKAEQEKILLL